MLEIFSNIKRIRHKKYQKSQELHRLEALPNVNQWKPIVARRSVKIDPPGRKCQRKGGSVTGGGDRRGKWKKIYLKMKKVRLRPTTRTKNKTNKNMWDYTEI